MMDVLVFRGVVVLTVGLAACSLLTDLSDLSGNVADAGSETRARTDGDAQTDAGSDEPRDATVTTDASTDDQFDASDASFDANTVPGRVLYFHEFAPRSSLDSIAAADAICMAARPSNVARAKALLVGTGRRACSSANCASAGAAEHIDWPLAPNTAYLRPDRMTLIGVTNSVGVFNPDLSQSIGTDNTKFVWTGLNPNGLGTWTDWRTSTSTCSDWSAYDAASYGTAAYAGPEYKANAAFGHFTDLCSKNFGLYCAEVLE